jgi:isopentenyl-diphosphate delta-isomerase
MAGTEVVDVVDSADLVVGTATVGDCLEKGLLHRAVAVVVLRADGRILLQRRSRRDLWHPGRWTLSSTGHVKSGESYPQAARRELFEELGIRARIKPLGKLLLPMVRSRGLTEWEHVALFMSATDAPARIDHEEIEELRAVSSSELLSIMRGPRLTPDAKVLLKRFIALFENRPAFG